MSDQLTGEYIIQGGTLSNIADAIREVGSTTDPIKVKNFASSITSLPRQIQYTAGDNIQISSDYVISATDTTYTAGTNITIENNVISATGGAGASTWSEVANKPFSSIGTGLTVEDDVLKAVGGSSGNSADWTAEDGETGYIYHRPFKTIGKNLVVDSSNALNATMPITASTTDLEDGVSPLATGSLYLVYEE